MSANEEVVEKKIGPEMAGERVGWVRFGDVFANGRRFVGVQLAMGHVGLEGAKVAYERDGDTDIHRTIDRVQGFTHVQSMYCTVPLDGSDDQANGPQLHSWDITRGDRNPVGAMLHGSQKAYGQKKFSDKIWSTSPTEIVNSLKSGLLDRGALDGYPSFYYWYNLTAFQEHFGSKVDELGFGKILLPDKDMLSVTIGQIETVDSIRKILNSIVEHDAYFRKNIDGVFSDYAQHEVVPSFELLRADVDIAGRLIRDLSTRLAFRGLGSRPPNAPRQLSAHSDPRGKMHNKESVYRALVNRETGLAKATLDAEIADVQTLIGENSSRRSMLTFLAEAERASLGII